MRHNEGGSRGFDGRAKELTDTNNAAVERPFINDMATEDTITGIEEENPQFLLLQMAHLGQEEISGVSGAANVVGVSCYWYL